MDASDLVDEIPCFALAETARGLQKGVYTHSARLTPIAFEDLVADQENEALCKDIREKMTKNKAPSFFLKDGALYRRGVNGDQLVIFHKHRATLLDLAHFPTTERPSKSQSDELLLEAPVLLAVHGHGRLRCSHAMFRVRADAPSSAAAHGVHANLPEMGALDESQC